MGPAAVPTSPRRDAEEPWPTSEIGAELRDSKEIVTIINTKIYFQESEM
jgi:hypothetical protein